MTSKTEAHNYMYNHGTIDGDEERSEVSALPHDSAARKAVPIMTGVLDYFPAAIAEVAKVSKAGNDKHNPGAPLHHARGKSTDHADSAVRHLMERGGVDPDTGMRHSAEAAWRALANLQQELEDAGLAPLARGATAPDDDRYGDVRNPPREMSTEEWSRQRIFQDLRRARRAAEAKQRDAAKWVES